MEYKNNIITVYTSHIAGRIKHQTKKFYAQVGSCVHKPYATPLLGFLFYLEAICFLPVDPILFVYCIERKNRALWYALVATTASVLGGITSYLLGSYLWQTMGAQIINNSLINCFATPAQLLSLTASYQKNGSLIILLIGIIPFVPYKAITLSAGFCSVSFIPFVICSFIVRSIRFFGCAIAIVWFSQRYTQLSRRSIAGITALLFCLLCIGWLIIRSEVVHY